MTASQIARQVFPLLLLTPFIAVFGYAGWVELRRWWLYGPSGNKRGLFPTGRKVPRLTGREEDD